jgi:hypothetical protein
VAIHSPAALSRDCRARLEIAQILHAETLSKAHPPELEDMTGVE